MKWQHAQLVGVAAAWLARRGCHAILTERGHRSGPDIPDAIGWDSQWIDDEFERYRTFAVIVEVKVSRSDFYADQSKPHRFDDDALGRERWYLLPKGMLEPSKIPVGWGFIEYDGSRCQKRIAPIFRDVTSASAERERDLLLRELRAYHAQGLYYTKGRERWERR